MSLWCLLASTIAAMALGENSTRIARLSSPVHLTGSVRDERQQPIGGVELVFGSDPNLRQSKFKTDANGNFDVTTTAPYLLFRKDGFDSVRLPTVPATALKITLKNASRTLAPCAANFSCYWVDGLRFCVPTVEGLVADPLDAENGHHIRTFRVTSIPGSTATMRHGGGVMWGFGGPSVSKVWVSKEYSEAVYLGGRIGTIDAKGTDATEGVGASWEQLGRLSTTRMLPLRWLDCLMPPWTTSVTRRRPRRMWSPANPQLIQQPPRTLYPIEHPQHIPDIHIHVPSNCRVISKIVRYVLPHTIEIHAD